MKKFSQLISEARSYSRKTRFAGSGIHKSYTSNIGMNPPETKTDADHARYLLDAFEFEKQKNQIAMSKISAKYFIEYIDKNDHLKTEFKKEYNMMKDYLNKNK